jgi:hypothetical protein
MDLPLNRESLVAEADNALRNSAQSSRFSDEHHLLLHETLDRGNSYPCKPGQEKMLPICLDVDETYIREKPTEKDLSILIMRKDMGEMKGSYAGGTQADDDGTAKIAAGVKNFAAGVAMLYITKSSHPPKFMEGLTPRKPWTKEHLLANLNDFGRWAYDRSPVVKITNASDIAAHIRTNVEHLVRDQTLADTIVTKGILVDGYQASAAFISTSGASQEAASAGATGPATDHNATAGDSEEFYFKTRLSDNAASITDHSLSELQTVLRDGYPGSFEIQLAEDAGKNKCYKADEWVALQSITITHPTDATKNNTFQIMDAAGAKKRVRIGHFRRVKDNSSEVDSDNSDKVDTDTD